MTALFDTEEGVLSIVNVTVHYTAQLKASLGIACEELTLDDSATTTDLLAALVSRHGESFRTRALTDDGSLIPSILLCVNDEQLASTTGSRIPPDATVSFISAISGG